MWWKRRRLSDREFVERIRGNTPARRTAGAIGLVVSLISFGLFMYVLQMVLEGEWTITETSAEQLAFQMGAMTGTVMMMALGGATWWFSIAIFMYFPDRKDELLLEYHRRLAELNRLPVCSE